MIINGNINISRYNASVSSKLIQPRTIEINAGNVKENYFLINEQEGMKLIEIRILFKDDTRDKVYKNISDFMVNFRDEVDIKFNNLSHNYKCYLLDSSIEETEFEEWLYLNLRLQGYEYGSLISNTINNLYNYSIENIGNLKAPCIVEITPRIDMIDFVIEGLSEDPIKIRTLRKNNKIVIDGIYGSIKVGEDNKFSDADIWEFPIISAGINHIKLSRSECSVIIKYYPRFM